MVTESQANILIRAQSTAFNLTYWTGPDSKTISVNVPANTDSAVPIRLEQLNPGSTYHYKSDIGHAGSFTTRDANISSFSLLSTSCQKPNWPYSPTNHPLRINGLEHLDAYIGTMANEPEMMLFLGDFICE